MDMLDQTAPNQIISIDQLTLRMPEGLQKRAQSIAKLLANELSDMNLQALGVAGKHNLDTLNLPKLTVTQGASDRLIACKIAQVISEQIRRRYDQEASPCR